MHDDNSQNRPESNCDTINNWNNDKMNGNDKSVSRTSLLSQEEYNLKCSDLDQSDFNRLRTFYSSKLNEPLISISSASVFTTFEMDLVAQSVTNSHAIIGWKCVARGAIILQINYDSDLPQEVCGAKVIVSNPKTCDLLWSTSLHSWNKYRTVDHNFHVFITAHKVKGSNDDESVITRDCAVGIYFENSKAAQQFNDSVTEYIERVIIHEKRDESARKEAIKTYKATKRSQRKAEPQRKSIISAPVMFIHTMHIKK